MTILQVVYEAFILYKLNVVLNTHRNHKVYKLKYRAFPKQNLYHLCYYVKKKYLKVYSVSH